MTRFKSTASGCPCQVLPHRRGAANNQGGGAGNQKQVISNLELRAVIHDARYVPTR
jgi:hypothetical protein